MGLAPSYRQLRPGSSNVVPVLPGSSPALVPTLRSTPAYAEACIAFASELTVLRDDVDTLLLADSYGEAFARTGGVPYLDAEPACPSDDEARLQTGANHSELGRTPTG